MLKTYFYKLVRSPFMYIGAFAVLALSFIGINNRYTSNILQDFSSLIGTASYRKIFVLLAALPFTSN